MFSKRILVEQDMGLQNRPGDFCLEMPINHMINDAMEVVEMKCFCLLLYKISFD